MEYLRTLPDNSVDLIFCSPPYEDARLYGELQYKVKGQEWVDWCVERYLECNRVCKGLVAWVVEGKTRKFQWSATPAMLMADLHRKGIKLRKPPAFHRVGIPGSGGPDWLRNDYEFIVCSSKGKLPWSDNTACGSPCRFAPGGDPSHRTRDGRRVNGGCREFTYKNSGRRDKNGERQSAVYRPPEIANPGNVIHRPVGKGSMGHDLAHENEAPFPRSLADFFVQSFCPPGGTALDIFSGSGTLVESAVRWQRVGLGIDIRHSQTELAARRLGIME